MASRLLVAIRKPAKHRPKNHLPALDHERAFDRPRVDHRLQPLIDRAAFRPPRGVGGVLGLVDHDQDHIGEKVGEDALRRLARQDVEIDGRA